MKYLRAIVSGFLIFCVSNPHPLSGFDDKPYDPTTLVFPAFLHTMGIRKATKTHLMIYTKNKVKVQDPQGIAVARLKSWDNPDEKKDDDEVTGYGVNSGQGVIVYNKSMTSLGFYGLNESEGKRLNNPKGIAANEKGDVYVADTGNNRIVRFFNPKKELKFVLAIGGKGALPGYFNAPKDVAMDANDMVYVADTGNHRIQVIRPDNRLDLWFGKQGVKDGELWHPSGIAVTNGKEKWSYYKDAFMVVIDLDGTRVQKFGLDGEFLGTIRLKDFGFKTGKLMYLAIDYYSNVWVTDFVNHCIHKFDRNLNYLTSFGRKGTGDKEFFEPRGIAIYKRFGQVFIAEKESAQYYWIGSDIFDFGARFDEKKQIIELDFFLTEPSFVTLTIQNGKLETAAFEKSQYFNGPQKIYLDGSLQRISSVGEERTVPHGNGTAVKIKTIPSGKYTLKLKIEPTYSSYQYFSKEVETGLEVP